MRALVYVYVRGQLFAVVRCPDCGRDVWIGWPLLFDWCSACATVARPGVAPNPLA